MRSSQHNALTASVLSLTLVGCSGGGTGDERVHNSSALENLTAAPGLVYATTKDIQRTAARRVVRSVGVNLASLQRLSKDAMRDLEPGSIGGKLAADIDLEMLAVLDSSNRKLMEGTLGVGDSNAQVSRVGNIVTIDPDEQLICAEKFPLPGISGNQLEHCEALLQELSVQIHAYTNESGLISYSFQNTDVLSIGYSDDSASYELQLAGLQQVVERAQQLSGSTVNGPEVMSGALRLSATVHNDMERFVSGELLLEVTQPINAVSAEGALDSVNLQPSTIFRISINEEFGDVITRVDWGSLQPLTDTSNKDNTTILSQLNLGALTANATLNASASILDLTNLGIGTVPLTININQVNTVSLGLAAFDLTIDAESGIVTFDGALGATLAIINILGVIDSFGAQASANLSINAEAGTTLRDEADEV